MLQQGQHPGLEATALKEQQVHELLEDRQVLLCEVVLLADEDEEVLDVDLLDEFIIEEEVEVFLTEDGVLAVGFSEILFPVLLPFFGLLVGDLFLEEALELLVFQAGEGEEEVVLELHAGGLDDVLDLDPNEDVDPLEDGRPDLFQLLQELLAVGLLEVAGEEAILLNVVNDHADGLVQVRQAEVLKRLPEVL